MWLYRPLSDWHTTQDALATMTSNMRRRHNLIAFQRSSWLSYWMCLEAIAAVRNACFSWWRQILNCSIPWNPGEISYKRKGSLTAYCRHNFGHMYTSSHRRQCDACHWNQRFPREIFFDDGIVDLFPIRPRFLVGSSLTLVICTIGNGSTTKIFFICNLMLTVCLELFKNWFVFHDKNW